MPQREECRAIVRAIAGLARSLNIITVAEGVETEQQLAMVIAEGCHECQGYLFSQPVPEAQLPTLLAKSIGLSVAA
jgi:EAL domain-containing protein (putative c-di-GMP-specific phosphodiesterase class I)